LIVSVACAAERVARGEIVAYPTETVYGLAADASAGLAVARLEALKGRISGKGMSILLAGSQQLSTWVPALPARARALAERFWPGPLTLVLACSDPRLAAVATPEGVGFRCSPQPTARALAAASPCPILSTSCNPSGQPPAQSADDVVAQFGDELPVVGGEPAGGLSPSTVLAVRPDGSIALLREGAIALAALLGDTDE
jgi:L-threonylcarbamoyladenylate synthase